MSNFVVQAVMGTSNFGGYELQLSNDNETVRVRDNYGQENQGITGWIKVNFDIEGDAYFNLNDCIYYLNQFMKI